MKLVRCWLTFRKIPGPSDPALPLVGHALLFRGGPVALYRELYRVVSEIRDKGYQLGLIWLCTIPMLVINGPDSAEVILRSSHHLEKSTLYDFLRPWLKTGLLTSHGDKWKSRRRLLTPTFHFEILHDFLEVMNEQSKIFLRKIDLHAKKNDIFDIVKPVTLCTLDIICETAMGQSVNAMGEDDSEYVKALCRTTTLMQHRMWTPWLWWDTFYNAIDQGRESARHLATLHGFTQKVIADRVERNKDHQKYETKKKRKAFLDMLLNAYEDKQLTLDGISEEVDTFMFEGHDTTSAALAWTFYMIGHHKEVQAKLHQEVDNIFKNKANDSITMEDVKNLDYLELVIKESMRLFPSVPIIGRKISQECMIDGHRIPVGTEVLLFTQVMHHDPKYWTDPDRFDPQRFTADSSEGRHPFCYIPFSAGPRNCIGQRFAMMEEKVILAHFLRKYNITSCQPMGEVQLIGDSILRPANGIQIKISNRI